MERDIDVVHKVRRMPMSSEIDWLYKERNSRSRSQRKPHPKGRVLGYSSNASMHRASEAHACQYGKTMAVELQAAKMQRRNVEAMSAGAGHGGMVGIFFGQCRNPNSVRAGVRRTIGETA